MSYPRVIIQTASRIDAVSAAMGDQFSGADGVSGLCEGKIEKGMVIGVSQLAEPWCWEWYAYRGTRRIVTWLPSGDLIAMMLSILIPVSFNSPCHCLRSAPSFSSTRDR